MRQHVNPLSRFFQAPRELPNIQDLFDRPDLPLHLDIGSARGKFLISMAQLNPNFNYIGVEIRDKLVKSANKERDLLNINNLHFLFCNVNVSLDSRLAFLPKDILQIVSIQFPDPWFKRRHWKRRVLQPSLLLELADLMIPGSKLFLQSDLFEVIQPMTFLINESDCFDRRIINDQYWLEENPLPIRSEREIYTLDKGFPVFRALYCRNKNRPPDLFQLEEKWQKYH